MCFCESASFISSGGLLLLGGATYAVAKKKDKILVAVPLLFGVQQLFEGIQWHYLNKGSSSLFAGYGFLVFALMVWPVYVPTLVYVLDQKHRKILRWFIFLGTGVALYFIILLLNQRLYINVYPKSVHYAFRFPHEHEVLPIYLIAIFGSLFFSSRPIFRWFGGAIFLLAVIAALLYNTDFVSVWCFFSAVVSSMFFVFVQHKRWRLGRKSI